MVKMMTPCNDLVELTRLFVRVQDSEVVANVIVSESTISLAKIWGMAKRGLVMYEEIPHFKRNFDVFGWDVILRPRGRALLKPVSLRVAS